MLGARNKVVFPLQFRRWASFKPEKPSEIQKLSAPIGVKQPLQFEPKDRTFKDKRRDFMDLKKNRLRREELKQQFAQSSFASIYGFRDTGGKFFVSAPKSWNVDKALYMPNINGTLIGSGLDTRLVDLLDKQKFTIVRLFSSDIAKKQIDSFISHFSGWDHVNLVDINAPTSFVNRWLVRWHHKKIQKSLLGPFHKYLIAPFIPDDVRKALKSENELGGYVFVVDKLGKIRWASSGPALDSECDVLHELLGAPSEESR